jgi:hypothetical protein
MAVEEKNPQYKNKKYEMRQLRDTADGVSSVKRSGALYLPIPTSMYKNASEQPPSGISTEGNDFYGEQSLEYVMDDAPFQSNIPAYQAYLQRARFPDVTSLLIRGLTGIAVKKIPQCNLPENISYLKDNATRDGKNLTDLFTWMISEVITVGRVTLLLDVTNDGKLIIVPYVAESFINWKTGSYEDKEVLSLGVFQHQVSSNDSDEFSHESVDGYFVVRNSANVKAEGSEDPIEIAVYATQKYKEEIAEGVPVIPLLRGKPFPFPPVSTCGANGVSFNFGSSPIVGVSDIAISIYQKEADMAQAEFLTCNPMLVLTGIQSDEAPKAVGSNVSLTMPDAESNAFYVEPKSNCLSHMKTRIDGLMEEAVQYGVSILGGSGTNPNEAADTVRMRQQSSNANLRTIIKSVSESINEILNYAYMWETDSLEKMPKAEEGKEDFGFFPSLELSEMDLSPDEQEALLQALLNNAISMETYLARLKEGGLSLAGKTVEGEIDLIKNSSPNLVNNDEDNLEDDLTIDNSGQE